MSYQKVASMRVRADFVQHLRDAGSCGTRFLILRRGEPAAAIVSVEDLHRLEALDMRAAARARAKENQTG